MEIPQRLVLALRSARSIAVITGAGISAESGLSTFRAPQTGLWSRYSPQELATSQAFLRDPILVNSWYSWRRRAALSATPNAGHRALVEMERHMLRQAKSASLSPPVAPFCLITQNVDRLHHRAGHQTMPIELHGEIIHIRCFRNCGHPPVSTPSGSPPPDVASAPTTNPEDGDVMGVPQEDVPLCEKCGGPMRPNVVWFGEGLPRGALEAAENAAAQCDVFFSVGTSSVVQPAALLAESALSRGAVVVEINPEATPLTPNATFVLAGPAADVLPAVVAASWPA
eukprot:TRINITY_DN56156_c0_g1_i1.p1 TRINITY_DN56156_c0_g1~~TRINITY_DN56156_c0_g1_i1.p1  ORF type:complete len:284 (-),score=11.62 TRINITY_DN56156_c0_g1_i1:327-1178(-)